MCFDILFGIHVVFSFPCCITMDFSIRGGKDAAGDAGKVRSYDNDEEVF